MMTLRKPFDYTLFLTTLFLVAVGMTMVFSASGILAKERFGDSLHFLKREVVIVFVGFIGMVVARIIPLTFYARLAYPLLLISILLMGLVFVPSLGVRVGETSRWIRLGPITLQPSEMAKIALVIYLAYILSKKQEKVQFLFTWISPLVFSGLLIGGVLLGKDLGGGAVMGATLFIMMFVGGAKPSFLASEILLAMPALYYLVASVPYRRMRILAFLNPWEHERGAGFQIIQSYVAFHVGSLFGQGLGSGKQKLFYLPEAHTDFIFSVVGEEMGLLGTLTVLGLFIIWLYRVFRISWRAPDLFSSYLAMGIGLMVGIQVVINVGVVSGLLPTKGLTLPFVSYGGSSMVISMIAVGILLNIASRSKA
ncbi:MAG: putative lipid II flippase FtsW [Deltaproteobacteria bacterium]|nr:putative lipid II flippase FtsW [Deltaproteobacteria bacterium]